MTPGGAHSLSAFPGVRADRRNPLVPDCSGDSMKHGRGPHAEKSMYLSLYLL